MPARVFNQDLIGELNKYSLTVSPAIPVREHPVIFDRPETFRLPAKGGDPYFGLTRGWYYAAEKDGLIRLVRLRKRGRQRGVTLVPYDDVAAVICAAKQSTSSSDQKGGNA